MTLPPPNMAVTVDIVTAILFPGQALKLIKLHPRFDQISYTESELFRLRSLKFDHVSSYRDLNGRIYR